MDDVTKALVAARAVLDDVGNWTTGAMARDASGIRTTFDDPNAVCFCAWGALRKVLPGATAHVAATADGETILDRATIRLGAAARQILKEQTTYADRADEMLVPVPLLNDNVGYEAVIRMYDMAIEAA